MSESLIDFHHVSKIYDEGSRVTALDEVTFSMNKGDFHFILGPSGAGKTTLMRLIYRDIRPSRGQILVNRRNVAKMSEKEIPDLRRRIGVVFQDFKLLTDRSVFDNVAISLLVRGEDKYEINRRVMRALEQVELTDKRDKNPRQLSGGEAQRVSLARALVKEPEILLADEPTGNLDPDLAGRLTKLLADINRRGTTLLVATHDYRIVENSNNPCLVLKDGRLVEGPTRNPEHLRPYAGSSTGGN
jgi:cell division transport system ATP-binding protein